jgi:peptidase M23-like protein
MVFLIVTLFYTCTTVPPPTADLWRWPLRPVPEVIRGFTPPLHPWGAGHRGVDLAGRPGQPIHTAGTGRVFYAGQIAGRGVIAISHGTLKTTYLPVRPSVHRGQHLLAGTRIGTLQHPTPHCGHRPCLHWGLLRNGTYQDPLELVRPQIRLLPHWPTLPPAHKDPVRSLPSSPSPSPSKGITLASATTTASTTLLGVLALLTLPFFGDACPTAADRPPVPRSKEAPDHENWPEPTLPPSHLLCMPSAKARPVIARTGHRPKRPLARQHYRRAAIPPKEPRRSTRQARRRNPPARHCSRKVIRMAYGRRPPTPAGRAGERSCGRGRRAGGQARLRRWRCCQALT